MQAPSDPTSGSTTANVALAEVLEKRVPPRRYLGRQEPLLEKYFMQRHALLRWSRDSVVHLLGSFVRITCTLLTLVVCGVSVGVLLAFHYTGTRSDLPVALLSSAIIFPISFGIGYNFNRREAVLKDFAVLKSTSMHIFLCCRDLPAPSETHTQALQRFKSTMRNLFIVFAETMEHRREFNAEEQVYLALDEVQKALTGIADSENNFRNTGAYVRIQQAFQAFVEAMERALVLHDYRSPSALRAFAMVFLVLYPVIFAPLFAKYAFDYGLWAGLYCSVLTSIMFTALHRVFANEEDPFDGNGCDDLSAEPVARFGELFLDRRAEPRKLQVFAEASDGAWSHKTLTELPDDDALILERHQTSNHLHGFMRIE